MGWFSPRRIACIAATSAVSLHWSWHEPPHAPLGLRDLQGPVINDIIRLDR